MIPDRSVLGRSRLHLQVLEHLWNKAQLKSPKARWVRLGDLLDHLVDKQHWGSYRALRDAGLDGLLLLLEDLGCVKRRGFFYSFGRFLRADDFAPIVTISDSETRNEPEAA